MRLERMCNSTRLPRRWFQLEEFWSPVLHECRAGCAEHGWHWCEGCYNIGMGADRNQKMSEESLALLVHRDTIAASHFWNGNFLGRAVFDQLCDHEKKLGAVMLTSNRCAMARITWKVARNVRPPLGHDTWRAWSRVQRASAP